MCRLQRIKASEQLVNSSNFEHRKAAALLALHTSLMSTLWEHITLILICILFWYVVAFVIYYKNTPLQDEIIF